VHIEGAQIAPGFESFVGLVSCPNRHGMTTDHGLWPGAPPR